MFRDLWRRLRKKKGKSPPTKPKGTNARNSNPSAPPTKHKGISTRAVKLKGTSTRKSTTPPPPPPLGLVWERDTVKKVLNLVEEQRSLTETEVAMDRIWSHDTWLENSSDSSRLRAALSQLLVLRLQLPKPTEVHGISESFARQTVFEYLLGCLRRLADIRSCVLFGGSTARAFLSFFETTIFHKIAESLKYPNMYIQPEPRKIGGTQPGPTEVVNMLLDLNDGINVIRPWAPSSSYSKDKIRDFIRQLLNFLKQSPDPSLRVRDVFLPVVLLLQRHTVQCQQLPCWADAHVVFALEELKRHAEISPIIPHSSYEFIENELPICRLVGRRYVAPVTTTPTRLLIDSTDSLDTLVPLLPKPELTHRYESSSRLYSRNPWWDTAGPDPFKDMKLRWTLDCAHSYRPGPSRLGPRCRVARRY